MGEILNSVVEVSRIGGTVTAWREKHKNVFFPQQEVLIEGKKKVRGGMHACFPNFGTVPEHFGLPQHGPLRRAEGRLVSTPGHEMVWFNERDNLLGTPVRRCTVAVDVESHPYFFNTRGFTYTLGMELSEGPPMPINVGLHPYFATPEGTATLRMGKEKYEVEGLIKNARQLAYAREFMVEIRGVGMVEMELLDEFSTPGTYLNLWRDSLDYFCIEPVLGPPQSFGELSGRYVAHNPKGWALRIGCGFRFFG